MAKKILPKKKSVSLFSKLKNPKAMTALLVLVLLVLGTLVVVARDNKNVTTEASSARDLANSATNKKNTKDIASKTAQSNSAGTTSGGGTVPPAIKKSATKATVSTSSTPTSSTPPSPPPASPTPVVPFEVESAIYSEVNPDWANVSCNDSADFTFSAYITANAAGSVTYHWERSDSASSDPITIVFSGAGTQLVQRTWTLWGDGSPTPYQVTGWEKVVVTSPNTANSKASDASFTMDYTGCV